MKPRRQQKLFLQLQTAPIQSANDLDQAFAEIAKAHVGGLSVILSPLSTLHSKRIVELAAEHRVQGYIPRANSPRKAA